jgi:arylsulfatase A-like enzyme
MTPRRALTLAAPFLMGLLGALPASAAPAGRPNIVWILAEDASPHIGCYGETAIATPRLDQLAREGVRFAGAFAACPVCSPSRSALIAGMYQTTFGSHNHRSSNDDPKAGGNRAYYDSYRVPEALKLIPELFAAAGYEVLNGGKGKEDYNFIPRGELYAPGTDWNTPGRAAGRPFFVQIQLHGGKDRNAKVANPTDPGRVVLPPYYPDDPVIRQDWASYLNSWIKADADAGAVLDRLGRDGLADSTAVFFFTDHGISHVRGKQFLYDEGIRVPLLVRLPDRRQAGTVRSDLVSLLDVAATSLDLAGIPIPATVQGRSLFAPGFEPRTRVYSARDRCDETVDLIRSVRTDRYKYIRNVLPQVSHAQPNRYKDGKEIMKRMRELNREGKLTELQARIFAPTRPYEELYDLKADPYETVNLAGDPRHRQALGELRADLSAWMVDGRDLGLIPEPILEEMGARYGSKYAVLQAPENASLVPTLLATIDAGARHDREALERALGSAQPAVRYWAVVWLGQGGPADADASASPSAALVSCLRDPSPAVRVAAGRTLVSRGHRRESLDVLARELDDANLVVGHYAIRALEEIGDEALPLLPRIQAARQSPYDSTRRIADRLSKSLLAARAAQRR